MSLAGTLAGKGIQRGGRMGSDLRSQMAAMTPPSPSQFMSRNKRMSDIHGAGVGRSASQNIARANPTLASAASRARSAGRGMSRRKKVGLGVGGLATAVAVKSTGSGSPNKRHSSSLYRY